MTPRRDVPLDPAAIFAALDEHEVAYVLIGGLAVQAHGHLRTTQDVDLMPDPDRANVERLVRALAALGAHPAGAARGQAVPPLDADAVIAMSPLALETRAGGLDIHFEPPGAAPYEAVRGRALQIELAGIRLYVAGLDDLIAMKLAAGRPLDRGDVLALTEGEARSGAPGDPEE